MNYHFKTRDCPDAGGRIPQAGEQKWTIYFPTEDGGRITIEVGKESRDTMLSFFNREVNDDKQAALDAMTDSFRHSE